MYYFIVNKGARSGKGHAVWRDICRVLKKKEVKFAAYKTKYPGHATKLAEKISSYADKDIRLVVVGGDGTLNEVINGVKNFSRVMIGVVPVGSGNDFARGLGITGTTEEIVNGILSNDTFDRVDIGRVRTPEYGERLFAISSGYGLDALVCKEVDAGSMKKVLNTLHLGKLTYGIQTVRSLFSMKTFRASGSGDLEGRIYNKVIFTAVMNMPAEGGGVPMAPNASPFDGHFSVCCASGIPKWKTFMLFPKLLSAKHENRKGFDIFETYRLKMSFDKPVAFHTDGEYLGDVSAAEYECLEGKLILLNPIP